MDQTTICDIDALLQDSWLQVISLRYGPQVKEGEGRVLWERCITNVERVQLALKASGTDSVVCRSILHAQCALLDETVRERGICDDAGVQWCNVTLQQHFLGVGVIDCDLCELMHRILAESAPNWMVLACFHRIMLLGFLGSFRSVNDPQRLQLIGALSERVGPLHVPQLCPLQTAICRPCALSKWLSLWPVCLVLSALFLAGIWWGVDSWLAQMLDTLFGAGQ